jgi:hypothetical protein
MRNNSTSIAEYRWLFCRCLTVPRRNPRAAEARRSHKTFVSFVIFVVNEILRLEHFRIYT